MEFLKKLDQKFDLKDEEYLESAKRMVNNTQQFVGIRNVFGDKNVSRYTMSSILLTTIFAGSFIYVGQFSQLAYFLHVLPDKVHSFQAMNCFSSTCVPLSKFFFMYLSRDRLHKITEMSRVAMETLSPGSPARKTMMSVLRKARYAAWLVILNQMFIHFVYLLSPFALIIYDGKRHLPTTPGSIFGMAAVKYQSPYYEITFTLTSIAALFSAFNQTGYIVLFVTLLGHELGHFYAITETLKEVYKIVEDVDTKEENDNDVDKIKNIESIPRAPRITDYKSDAETQKRVTEMLRFCVKHHQFLYKFHDAICVLYKLIFGAHFLIMVIVLVTTLQTLNSWGIINTLLTFVTGIMPLLVYCFGGEMLITAQWEMSQAIYSCGWQGMNIKHARTVLLMLCLSQQPLHYTAAGIFIMNNETFGDVVQVVYKIYAVFN